MKNTFDDDLNLDPQEILRMENQILELKLKAEFGAETFSGGDIPADAENAFLKNVLEFENTYLQSGETRISDILGNPLVIPEMELNDPDVEIGLEKLKSMLFKHNITVDFGGSYDTRTKYRFITEELFEQCVFHAEIPGMMMHFIYEEFHPDHRIDLESKAQKFISAWFKMDIDKLLWELSDTIILPEGPTINKAKVKEGLQSTFNRFIQFSECNYVVANIKFDVNDDAGMALAEGIVNYSALMSNQEAIAIQGPFKLYFCLEYGWWDICYFVFPGFEFKRNKTR